ncbi:hypothetical protein GX50_03384 [[Emmonsia] crescens]|uniref:Myb-like DNA-binding domain-containing protein n=1 Tax=[Emmonsia] crescens TaxID=73230 RepID=A0A2B7ZJK9_9EURO|nr:hypothetical protein GX50_03384 [Emmonsia crescens]
MPAATSDEQLNFLLRCVKYSSNGKVDFDQVARECNIVTKGAAAKRYERLMKANGINPNGGTATGTDASSPQEARSNGSTPKKSAPKTPTKAKGTTGTKTPSTRKRKTAGKANGTSKKIKSEKLVGDSDDTDGADSKTRVKSENSDDNIFGGERGEAMIKSSNDPLLSEGFGVVEGSLDREDGELYNEFCAINATSKQYFSGGPCRNGDYAHGGSENDTNGAEDGELGMLDRGDEV